MSKISDVTVQDAIVHITDKNEAAPVYSDVALDLPAEKALRDYFTGQVRNALDDDHTGAARFAATGPQDAKNACLQILASAASFVSESQKLAQLLHAAMQTHHRIAPGSLAVCIYTAGGDPSRHLALIKLDPGSALVQKVVKTQKGERLVSFDVRENVMPTARERLHKAALVPPAASEKYDLLLLDRQTTDALATFWAETFLNTTPVVDGKTGARDFKRASHLAYSRLLKDKTITPAEADTFREHVDVALQTPRVKLSAFVQRLPLPKAAKDVVDIELEKKFAGTKTIPIDVGFASERLTKKVRFRGDYGVVFEVESAHFDDVVKEKTDFDGPNETPMTRLVLEVPRLQWVK